jgi:hypothetical protein
MMQPKSWPIAGRLVAICVLCLIITMSLSFLFEWKYPLGWVQLFVMLCSGILLGYLDIRPKPAFVAATLIVIGSTAVGLLISFPDPDFPGQKNGFFDVLLGGLETLVPLGLIAATLPYSFFRLQYHIKKSGSRP